MLFITRYQPRGRPTEADEKRVLQLFSQWKPPPGVEVKGWWVSVDGGGVQLTEASSAEAIFEGLAPWGVFFEYTVQPALDIQKAVELSAKGVAWRDSVKKT